MRLFLTILEGRTPGEAEPILATEDGRVIQLVGSWLAGRLSLHHRDTASGVQHSGPPGQHDLGGGS